MIEAISTQQRSTVADLTGRDEAKFWLKPSVVQAYNHGFDARTINRIQRLVETHRGQLEEA